MTMLGKLYKLLLFVMAAAPVCAGAAPVSVVVDTGRAGQQILGFGASGCWWAQDVGGWPEAQRRELIRLLYDKETGIGLGIYRHNLGADTHADQAMHLRLRRTESMLDTKSGRYDWTRDAKARLVMREAVEAGANEVVLFANSAPINMTKNGRGYGTKDGGKKVSNLAPGHYAEYAAYLGEVTGHFINVEKLPVKTLSPVNEPEWDWAKPNQEGSFYTPAEVAAIIKATYKEIQRRSLPVRIEGPEGGSWKTTIPYFEAINKDPELRSGLTDFAVHSYWTNLEQKRGLRAWLDKNRPDARLHMTEWCDMKHGITPGMDGAMPLANTVIDDFIFGRVSTWQAWLAASPYDFRDGLISYDRKTRALTLTKRYWVLGQFSRYLAKGSVVVAVRCSDKQVRAMAARLPDGRVAVVCANLSDVMKPLLCKIGAKEEWALRMEITTDEKRNMSGRPNPSDGVTLPAQSVVTLIFENTSGNKNQIRPAL
jgi:O-glycosyl hydrolase